MKQGMTRKLAPKDKHTKASWKKRDEGRKGKQEEYKVMGELEGGDPDARLINALKAGESGWSAS